MRGHSISEINNAPIGHNSLAACEINLDVVIIEKFSIERVDRFVDRLLGREEQPSAVWIVANSSLLFRRCNQFQQLRRKHFSRLDVNSYCGDIAAFSDNRHSDTIIVCE